MYTPRSFNRPAITGCFTCIQWGGKKALPCLEFLDHHDATLHKGHAHLGPTRSPEYSYKQPKSTQNQYTLSQQSCDPRCIFHMANRHWLIKSNSRPLVGKTDWWRSTLQIETFSSNKSKLNFMAHGFFFSIADPA